MTRHDGIEVGAVSRATGVTVRTLHYYEQVGLLLPSDRSPAGYRLYSEADLERLRRILFYRELGFGLNQIGALLDDQVDPTVELHRQRRLVTERIRRLEAIAAAIDQELEAEQMGKHLTSAEKFEVFGDGWSDDYADEAEARWGDTETFQQSQRRAANYDLEQWRAIRAAAGEIEQAFVRLMLAGVPADSTAAAQLAEAHRQHIVTWFNDVPYQLHRSMAEMYLADPRFAAYYDRIEPGLARYVSDAIVANADPAVTGQ